MMMITGHRNNVMKYSLSVDYFHIFTIVEVTVALSGTFLVGVLLTQISHGSVEQIFDL